MWVVSSTVVVVEAPGFGAQSHHGCVCAEDKCTENRLKDWGYRVD